MKKNYSFFKISEESQEKIAALRQIFSDAHEKIEELCPNSRERSTGLTHLEGAAMWIIKSVAHNEPQTEALDQTSAPAAN